MKGKYYSTWKLIIICCIVLGATAFFIMISECAGYGKISALSMIISVVFGCALMIVVILNMAKESIPNKEVKEAEHEETTEEKYDDPDTDPYVPYPELPEEPAEGLPDYESENIQNESSEMTEVSISQKNSFSVEVLKDCYNFDNGLTFEERKRVLDKFNNCRQNLELTENARNQVIDLKTNTAILCDSDSMGAYFCLYDGKYMVPALASYMNWDKRGFSDIENELAYFMMRYMFTYEYEKMDKSMCIASLYPATVTKNADGEYVIEEENKGRLYFKSLN